VIWFTAISVEPVEEESRVRGGAPAVWWIAVAFLAVQVIVIAAAANGPFVDEGLYIVAGLRALEGHAAADGYARWFNGSPFVWPVLAALGYRVAGLEGARLMAAVLSTITLLAFARTAAQLLGPRAAGWGALLLALNGLFLALAHFAVYDVPSLTGLALAMYCLTRPPSAGLRWPVLGGIAFAAAVIAKYGHVVMIVPLVGLLVSVRGVERAAGPCAAFLAVAGVVVATYFEILFGAPFPASASAYLGQTFERSRIHIGALQAIFAAAPLALMGVGAVMAWRKGQRLLAVTCAIAMALYPSFHLLTANFVSGQKHVVAGFLFAYLLGGLALHRLWESGRRAVAAGLLAVLAVWGGAQCYWQDRSWCDVRSLARHLIDNMQRGDRVVAESSWSYTVYLYPTGRIDAPAAVIDANYAPARDRQEVCAVPWLVGNPESAPLLREAVARCPHQLVRSVTTQQYYIDASRLRVGVQQIAIGLYHRP
jgi:hypothetical protein